VSVSTSSVSGRSWLLCRVGDCQIAVPLAHVVETMRPLPLRAFPGLPPFVPGVSLIRDAVVPIVDLARLVGAGTGPAGAGESTGSTESTESTEGPTSTTRLVSVNRGDRTVALRVDAVIGVRTLDGATLQAVPALLDTLDGGALAAVGTLDSALLLVLGETLLVPDQVWARLSEADPEPDPSGAAEAVASWS
jgi:purine-binding chemotaxis protein CheW